MKKLKIRNSKKMKTSGITLVALIVTIIILLILSGVVIASVNNNGIFKNAKIAKEKYNNSSEDEQTKLNDYSSIIDNLGSIGQNSRDNKIDFIYKITPTSEVTEFNYTGSEQEFTAQKDGYYKIECWGAQGSSYGGTIGGKGAYTKGIIKLSKGDKLYVYVGECYDGYKSTMAFNGGGYGGNYSGRITPNGGGATDIRLINGNWDSFEGLKNRIMVAGGGSGSHYFSDGNFNMNGSPAGALKSFNGGYCGTGSPSSYRSSRCYSNARRNFSSLLQR